RRAVHAQVEGAQKSVLEREIGNAAHMRDSPCLFRCFFSAPSCNGIGFTKGCDPCNFRQESPQMRNPPNSKRGNEQPVYFFHQPSRRYSSLLIDELIKTASIIDARGCIAFARVTVRISYKSNPFSFINATKSANR